MNGLIELSELDKQEDGVWSDTATADLENFQPSDYFGIFESINDLSSLNNDLVNYKNNLEQELTFSPMRANLLRPFDWVNGQKVLEIGCRSGVLTRFLAEQGLSIDAVESSRQLAQLAYLRINEFDPVKIICQEFREIDFETKKYDVIVLNGLSDYFVNADSHSSYQRALIDLLLSCKQLLTDKGRIFLSADNRQGIKYIYGATDERSMQAYYGFNGYEKYYPRQTLNLSEWRALIAQLGFQQIQEYYLFPDYRFTEVLLGQNYCSNNPYAFQHLEGIRSKDYFQFHALGVNEVLLYQGANAHGHLGDFANSCLFVLGQFNLNDELDFAHLPSFKRKQEFISIVSKKADEETIQRQKLFTDKFAHESASQTESYIKGCQLSVKWRNAILSDHRGIEFEQYLLKYFKFLQKLDSGVIQGINIDAIANNVIVDDNGEYHLIDCEWSDLEQGVDAVIIFYRAVVHFALRNDSIFHYFNWAKGISTLGDFVSYCFKTVGVQGGPDILEKLRLEDIEFLSYVLTDSVGYNFSDALGYSASNKQVMTFIRWRHQSQDYDEPDKAFCKASANNEYQNLTLTIDATSQQVECIRFYPFEHLKIPGAGYFGLNSLTIKAIDSIEDNRIILNLTNSEEINKANIHETVFYGEKDGENLFMFNSNNTFLEFEVPEYRISTGQSLLVEINFRLSASHDYEIAREKYGLADRKAAEQLNLKDEQLKVLTKKFNKQKKLLEEIEASRIWRLLEAYRDTFKISGYPQKNFFARVGHLISRFKASKNRPEKDWSD